MSLTDEWQKPLSVLLEKAGMKDAKITAIEALKGGVSSDIVVVTFEDGAQVCAKRALPVLKVAAHWEAPVERNHYEVAWLKCVAAILPDNVPAVLAEDIAGGTLLMQYLPAESYGLWKSDLMLGHFDHKVILGVAQVLGAIHAHTWEDADIKATFSHDDLFDALRLTPYLRSLIKVYPELQTHLEAIISATLSHKCALVHGDVSPKNILIPKQNGTPVFLDAECAWYGDPAFDAAFCLTHLLLKAAHLPVLRPQLLAASVDFLNTWSAALPDTGADAAKARCLTLLPCLILARIDGVSPVEYLSDHERATLRTLILPLIGTGPSLATVTQQIDTAFRSSRV
ncbi:MAG: aminoglycoside phosphotransferase family protein [Asticcacaulis sp.]